MERYCPSCGQDAPVTKELSGAYVMYNCQHCGLGLGVGPATQAEVRALAGAAADGALGRITTARRAQSIAPAVERGVPRDARRDPAPAREPAAVKGPPPERQMRQVYVVDDSGFLRQVVGDLLVERQLCREVVGLDDGPAFLEALTRALESGERPDLIVLDVRMPAMDGREAAIAARTLETIFGVQKRIPILFFSAVLCDAEFKETLKTLGAARYIRKIDGDVQSLGERVAAVLAKLIGA